MRLTYHGVGATAEPLLSQLSRELDLNFSILQGTVGKIKETPFGQLVIVIEHAEALTRNQRTTEEEIREFFSRKNVDFEVLRA